LVEVCPTEVEGDNSLEFLVFTQPSRIFVTPSSEKRKMGDGLWIIDYRLWNKDFKDNA
jgi:hypothetical protein